MIKTGSALRQLSILDEVTSRDFRGGLDITDSELNLSSKYARELRNMIPGIDGSLSVMQGCRLFGDLTPISDYDILDYRYFAGNVVVLNEGGEIFAVNGLGVAARIWDATIAAAKRAGLVTWGATSYVAFEEFGGSLLLVNGKDKPLEITVGLSVDYLADAATGSNINVPISKIIAKFNRHVIMAIGSEIYVSERDAAGTWPGDAGAIYTGIFDLSSYVTVGDATIVGLIPFKNFLLVQFRECIVPVQFTEIDSPASLQISVTPDSVIANYGTVSPRSLQDIGEQVLQMDIVGVSNVQLSTFTKILSPDRPSRLVDPLIQKALDGLNTDTLHDHVFALYDRRLSIYMLFIPDGNTGERIFSKGFGYRYIDSLKLNAWFTINGMYWHCGTRSSEGRIFLSRQACKKIFVLGDENSDPIYANYVGEQETFSDGTTFTDQTGLGPVANVNDSGVPIKFSWELPWSPLKHRGLSKTLRYVLLDTEGDQPFTMQFFVDRYYEVQDGGETFTDNTVFSDNTGFIRTEPEHTPALEVELMGGDARGYGLQSYGTSPYGSGNVSASHALTLTPTKFVLGKLRFEGETSGPLRFSGITLLYQKGTVRRLPYG